MRFSVLFTTFRISRDVVNIPFEEKSLATTLTHTNILPIGISSFLSKFFLLLCFAGLVINSFAVSLFLHSFFFFMFVACVCVFCCMREPVKDISMTFLLPMYIFSFFGCKNI